MFISRKLKPYEKSDLQLKFKYWNLKHGPKTTTHTFDVKLTPKAGKQFVNNPCSEAKKILKTENKTSKEAMTLQ